MHAYFKHSILLRTLIVTSLMLMALLPAMQVCGSAFTACNAGSEQMKSCCPSENNDAESGTIPVLIPGSQMQDCHPLQQEEQLPCNCECQLTQTGFVYEQPFAVHSQSDTEYNFTPIQIEFLSFSDKAQPHSGLTVDINDDTGSPPVFIRNCIWLI